MSFATTEVPLRLRCKPLLFWQEKLTDLWSINAHWFLEQIALISLLASVAFADSSELSVRGNILEITMLVAGEYSSIWVARFSIPSVKPLS